MIEDIASAKDAVLDWKTYQKGLEILAATLSSSSYGSEIANKSLTVADLLIKVSHYSYFASNLSC